MSINRFLISGIGGIMMLTASASQNLPKVIILGKPYYCYETAKDDSLFGISKQFGWELSILSELNPNVSVPIAKGTLIYYPAEEKIEVNPNDATAKDIRGRRVTHKIQSGETVYSIAKTYGMPIEELYALNPSARDGIRAGESLVISQGEQTAASDVGRDADSETVETVADAVSTESVPEYTFYNVEDGDTLYDIARRYNTTVEDIYKDNPGVSPDNIHEGETLRLTPGTRDKNIKYEKSTEDRLVSVEGYKVGKGETWASVARKLGVDEQLLRESNPGKWKLRKNDVLNVPRTREVEVEHAYHEEDSREQTVEGRRELYDEVHDINSSPSVSSADARSEVRVAIILEDTSSNRDMEFSRGALLAVDRMSRMPFKSVVTLLDGMEPMSKILTTLETFRPDLIITTSDKELPQYLGDYASRTSTELINAFDTKSEAYIDNPYVYQFLTPSSYFNDAVVRYVENNFKDYNLLIVDDISASDKMGECVVKGFDDKKVILPLADIAGYTVDSFGKYLVYGTPTRKDDVVSLLDAVKTLRESTPTAEIRVLGRPNWITFTESLATVLGETGTVIPSRFYFNSHKTDNRAFIDDYGELYGQTPIKSYPVYAVAGYDILTYFMPNINATDCDFNATFNPQQTLQSDISLERISNWGGMFNPNCYMIEFDYTGEPRKIIID